MMLSTRSRYGLRMMIELAVRDNLGRPILLKEISAAQNISEKYLSKLVIPLKSEGLVVSSRGSKGGYNLARDASLINVYDIVSSLEGGFVTVPCIPDTDKCERTSGCSARHLWEELNDVIKEFLTSKTLEELAGLERDARSSGMYYI